MKINSVPKENINQSKIYEIIEKYVFPNSYPILEQGFYTENYLKLIIGESFEFALNCTNFKDSIKEKTLDEINNIKEEILEEPTEEVVEEKEVETSNEEVINEVAEEPTEEKEVKEKTTKELKDNKKNTKNKK
jgi:outer membrane biosynthesis protein TonB